MTTCGRLCCSEHLCPCTFEAVAHCDECGLDLCEVHDKWHAEDCQKQQELAKLEPPELYPAEYVFEGVAHVQSGMPIEIVQVLPWENGPALTGTWPSP